MISQKYQLHPIFYHKLSFKCKIREYSFYLKKCTHTQKTENKNTHIIVKPQCIIKIYSSPHSESKNEKL